MARLYSRFGLMDANAMGQWFYTARPLFLSGHVRQLGQGQELTETRD